MKILKTIIITIFVFNISLLWSISVQINFYTTIHTVINAEKFIELPVYQVSGQQEKYILLKDLAKILSATLTYYSVGRYVSFNCRGEKLYFYVNKNYFLWNKKKIELTAYVLNIKNRIFVPISILNNPIFANNILNVTVEYRKEENILIINWLDSINLSYYITKNKAIVEYKCSPDIHYEYNFEDNVISLTFFSGKVQPKEYKIEDSVIDKITVFQQNDNVASEIFLNGTLTLEDVDVKVEEYKDKLIIDIAKKMQSNQVSQIMQKDNKNFSEQKDDKTEYEYLNKYVKNENDTTKIASIPAYKTEKKKYNKTIVIDPGHGGEDPGAIGKYGTQEKYVNLSISKKVAKKLKEEGFNVLLTREDDTFIPLVKRTNFANDNNADIFISIHCNASEKPTGTDHGFEIYFLSEAATSPDAVATEKLENEVVKFEKPTEELTRLQKILWSMIVNEFINESSKICSLIGNEVVSRTKQNYRGVKQAGFYVLRGAQMPAVLVECGFISHPNEELKLNHNDFQEMIADGIVSAIKKYYENGKN